MKKTACYRLDLRQLMAICDANYIRLLKLMPDLESSAGESVCLCPGSVGPVGNQQHALSSADGWCFGIAGSASAGQLQICIRVLESFRYTQTLELYASPDIAQRLPAPVIQVRVYHDAATTEVMSYQRQGGFAPRYAAANDKMYQQDEKLQVNRFLGEWLTLCLDAGASLGLPQPLCPV